MIILTINSGSTSVKMGVFEAASTEASPREILREKRSGRPLEPQTVLEELKKHHKLERIDAIAHRVVHGGAQFSRPVRIDDEVEKSIAALSTLAPLHNPVAVRWIQAARSWHHNAVHVAAFDTAFFAGLPRVASEYAVPQSLGADRGVRRFGFHGLAHEAMWRRWCELHPELAAKARVISLQLGGGCSLAAMSGGKPIDTSMGFSPLEGLVMATRTGDIDPAVVPYLAQKLGCSGDEIIARFNQESGLLGVSGISPDVKDLLDDPSERAQFAVELYCYRARKYVGAYMAALGGCEAIIFGGGVGEHIPQVRERILAGMDWAGIGMDPTLNAAAMGQEARISAKDSAVSVMVLPVDEERALARAAVSVLRDAR